jgi:hypothetical protein
MSQYFLSLSDEDRERYTENLTVVGLRNLAIDDPFLIEEDGADSRYTDDPKQWPEVSPHYYELLN